MPVLTFDLDRVSEELRALGLRRIALSAASAVPGPAVSPRDFLPRVQVRVEVPEPLAVRAMEILSRGT